MTTILCHDQSGLDGHFLPPALLRVTEFAERIQELAVLQATQEIDVP